MSRSGAEGAGAGFLGVVADRRVVAGLTCAVSSPADPAESTASVFAVGGLRFAGVRDATVFDSAALNTGVTDAAGATLDFGVDAMDGFVVALVVDVAAGFATGFRDATVRAVAGLREGLAGVETSLSAARSASAPGVGGFSAPATSMAFAAAARCAAVVLGAAGFLAAAGLRGVAGLLGATGFSGEGDTAPEADFAEAAGRAVMVFFTAAGRGATGAATS